MDKAGQDNRSNQCNPNNPAFQGHDLSYTGIGTKSDLDNHANQLNPNNAEFGGGNRGGGDRNDGGKSGSDGGEQAQGKK